MKEEAYERIFDQLETLLKKKLEDHTLQERGNNYDKKTFFMLTSRDLAKDLIENEFNEKEELVYGASQIFFKKLQESDRMDWKSGSRFYYFSSRDTKTIFDDDTTIMFREISLEEYLKPPLDSSPIPEIADEVYEEIPKFFEKRISEIANSNDGLAEFGIKNGRDIITSSGTLTDPFILEVYGIEIKPIDNFPEHFLPIKKRFYQYYEELIETKSITIRGNSYTVVEFSRVGWNLSLLFKHQ